jgi:ATP-dependent helicase HrpA
LDDHLKLRFAVVDEKDHELAAGRDISVLRQEFTEEEESQAFAKERRNWEKDGMTTWDFGELPHQITLKARGFNAAVAFPALALTEKGIGIRLFRSEAEAGRAHRKGVRGLLALRFHDELKHLRKGIVPTGDLKLWAAAFGGIKVLENAIIDKVLCDLFEADIRTASDFETHGEKVRPHILLRGQMVLRMAGPPLKALYEATELLRFLEGANRGNRMVLSFLAELRDEISRLLPSDFLIRFDEDRLIHIGRYLRALAIRAERGALHLDKAREKGKEINDLMSWHAMVLRDLPPFASDEKRQALSDFSWLIEEYKVSLFAQELKTAIPVSRKRIEARMGDIQRML